MKASVVVLTCVISLLCASHPIPAFAETIVIEPDGSGDQPTIQAGIEAANTGDIVQLASGTFTGAGNYDIDFMGKAITVRSESSAEATIIDCEQNGRGFIFQNAEMLSSVLQGVTIQNGSVGVFDSGGAIYCDQASPSIVGNIIQNNTASGGGGIACNTCNPDIVGNTISGNSAGGQEGGGIWLWFSHPYIADNVISNNDGNYGGGIYTVMISGPLIEGNVLYENSAFNAGGGIFLDGGVATLTGNVIYENEANVGGGIGAQNVDGVTVISQNTVSENHSHAETGGNIWVAGSPTINNTIMTYSTGGEGLYCGAASEPLVTCCLIYGNAGGDDLCGIDNGGNLFVDPEFCGTLGSYYYFLQSDSPCTEDDSPCGTLIGALDVGCDMVGSEKMSWGGMKSLYR